jgi:TPR repeat protein
MTRVRRFVFHCLALAATHLFLAVPPASSASDWAQDAERLRTAGQWREAAATLEPVAVSGNAQAQAMLGNLLLARANPARDEPAALRWLRRAARQGNVNALATIG